MNAGRHKISGNTVQQPARVACVSASCVDRRELVCVDTHIINIINKQSNKTPLTLKKTFG